MIYLYGLLEGNCDPNPVAKDLLGVTGDVFVKELPEGQLIYGPHDGSDILAKRRFLLAHTRVLEAFIDVGTVLPMRFGMVADSLDAVAALVKGQGSIIAEQLTRLSGLVELGVRVSFDRDIALQQQLQRSPELEAERQQLKTLGHAGHFKHAEFGRRLAEALERHRTNVQRALTQALKSETRDLVLRAPEDDVQVLAADVLVPRDAQAHFARRLDVLARGCDFANGSEPQIRLIGPAPPYNFVHLALQTERDAA